MQSPTTSRCVFLRSPLRVWWQGYACFHGLRASLSSGYRCKTTEKTSDDLGAAPALGPPRRLGIRGAASVTDLHPGGEHFAKIVRGPASPQTTEIVVIANWLDDVSW
jgi:hypothetical protein